MAGIDYLMEFAHYLSTNGCGAMGKALFVNVMPDNTTGAALFLTEISGTPPALTFSTGSYIRTPRFRIDARSTGPSALQADYPDITTARNLIQLAFQSCVKVGGTKMISTGGAPSTGNWLFALPEQDPFLAGRDDKNRVYFAFQAGCERQGP